MNNPYESSEKYCTSLMTLTMFQPVTIQKCINEISERSQFLLLLWFLPIFFLFENPIVYWSPFVPAVNMFTIQYKQ